MNPCFAKSIHGIQHLMRFEIVLLVIHGARNPGEYCAKIIQGYFTGTGAIPSGGFTITNSTTQWYAYCIFVQSPLSFISSLPETKMSFWWHFCHQLHRKLSFRQLSVPLVLVTKMSSFEMTSFPYQCCILWLSHDSFFITQPVKNTMAQSSHREGMTSAFYGTHPWRAGHVSIYNFSRMYK